MFLTDCIQKNGSKWKRRGRNNYRYIAASVPTHRRRRGILLIVINIAYSYRMSGIIYTCFTKSKRSTISRGSYVWETSSETRVRYHRCFSPSVPPTRFFRRTLVPHFDRRRSAPGSSPPQRRIPPPDAII